MSNFYLYTKMKRIVLFASGSGSNVENIIKYFQDSKTIQVTHVLTNNKNAKVIDRCNRLNTSCLLFDKTDIYSSDKILNFLKKEADYLILAGFLWKIPQQIIDEFPNKIINIHPALLPKYGGKGMYGMHVHEAIVKNKEVETGITIHFVNNNYDEGAVIFQTKVTISKSDTSKDVALKIHLLEMQFFPKIIKEIVCILTRNPCKELYGSIYDLS